MEALSAYIEPSSVFAAQHSSQFPRHCPIAALLTQLADRRPKHQSLGHLLSELGVSSGEYILGEDTVFFTRSAWRRLAYSGDLTQSLREPFVCVIQWFVRGFLCRQRFLRYVSNSMNSLFHSHLILSQATATKLTFKSLRRATITIQSCIRMIPVRKRFLILRKCAVMIQVPFDFPMLSTPM
jgi:hypothetical protein